jgi:hypothetical protein
VSNPDVTPRRGGIREEIHMVQVDVFWGYGWGASLAAAAGRPLVRAEQPFATRYFVSALIFLSLFWAPTGMLLLLRHPSWETMQAAASLGSMSEWLILGFGITNITQGMLGFWVGRRLLASGQRYLAQLNWIAGYFGMFFILLYGWDGLGYDRFLYDRDLLPGSPAWTPGAATVAGGGVLPALWQFLHSGVAQTLYIDGAYLLPPFFFLACRYAKQSFQSLPPGERPTSGEPSSPGLIGRYLGGVFLVGFGGAAFCAAVVRGVAYLLGVGDHIERGLGHIPANTASHVLSYVVGLPLGLLILWYSLLRPGRLVQRYLRPLWQVS